MVAPSSPESSALAGGLERLLYRVERLGTTLRFTYAFHAREVRFERDDGDGFARAFPETFSFHIERHDPTELYLQFEDLWSKPYVISAQANRRDAELVMQRLLIAMPGYLERLLERLEGQGLADDALARVYGDVATLSQVAQRFLDDKQLHEQRLLRTAGHQFRKVSFRALLGLVRLRVTPAYLTAYEDGGFEPLAPDDDLSESAFARALVGEPEMRDRYIVGMAQRGFFRWLEEVCLDEENRAFEREDSPFASRESEVLAVVRARGATELVHGRDFTPFLRRAHNRDGMRVLEKLELWFLRQYDIAHAGAVTHHANCIARGEPDRDRRLTFHSPRNYALALAALTTPFVGAALFYERAPLVFDLICTVQAITVTLASFWFLMWRFMWRHDLTAFRASVPRVAAGIIVGYLPVFLIDEVWDLAQRPWFPLGVVMALLGGVTLLYLYIEVQRRLGDPRVAFVRARALFLLGLIEAFCMGLVVTSLLGGFMVTRNWGDPTVETSVESLRATLPPVVGDLPIIIGIDPLVVFPTVVLLMTFLSFFIGTFLQLMWEDLPITEPL